jgi:hypothetical protein
MTQMDRMTGSGVAKQRTEHGSALVVAMLSLMLLTALGLALMLTTASEMTIAANFRDGQEAFHAADAAMERSMQDILTVPDWNTLLSGETQSSFIDGPAGGTRTLPDGSSVSLTGIANVATCGKPSGCSDADVTAMTSDRPWGSNNPRFQLYAYGPVAELMPTDTINSPFYVVVMVGDDPSENDDDPRHDGTSAGNPGSGVLTIRAEAFGPRGVHRVVEATVARTATVGQERGYVGQRGQDEQNRRARKASVQTPGKALSSSELNISTGSIQ